MLSFNASICILPQNFDLKSSKAELNSHCYTPGHRDLDHSILSTTGCPWQVACGYLWIKTLTQGIQEPEKGEACSIYHFLKKPNKDEHWQSLLLMPISRRGDFMCNGWMEPKRGNQGVAYPKILSVRESEMGNLSSKTGCVISVLTLQEKTYWPHQYNSW